MTGTEAALRVAIFVTAALLLLSLTACAEPYWVRDMPDYAPERITVQRLETAAALSLRCRMPRTPEAACAIRYADECQIYLGPRADTCALSHKRKHCAGYAHPLTQVYRQECGA